MTSPHSFHERAEPVSDTVGLNLPRPAPRAPSRAPSRAPRPASRALRPALRVPPVAPRAYAFCPLAVSLDSIVNIAS
jgi:hypothetical protein